MCLLFIPLVYGIHFAATAAYIVIHKSPPPEHPLLQLGTRHPSILEMAVILEAAVIAAPVLEEFLFRGLLLPWTAAKPWAPLFLYATAMMFAILFGQQLEAPARLEPPIFVLAMGILMLIWPSLVRSIIPNPRTARAIFATALVFAIAHTPVWPYPVALFFMGLALGYLFWRTQSLLGPILFHSFFNAIACLVLLLGD
jgi:membrane protease YdiL (CAAX protease family)